MWGILKTESPAIKTQSCGEKNLITELNTGLSVLLYPSPEYFAYIERVVYTCRSQ